MPSGTATNATNSYVDLLLAMLVIEDALLGILMATLPLIAGHSAEKSHSLAHVPLGSVHNFFHGTFGGLFLFLFCFLRLVLLYCSLDNVIHYKKLGQSFLNFN